jgi:hypothetical protein
MFPRTSDAFSTEAWTKQAISRTSKTMSDIAKDIGKDGGAIVNRIFKVGLD